MKAERIEKLILTEEEEKVLLNAYDILKNCCGVMEAEDFNSIILEYCDNAADYIDEVLGSCEVK